jgi:hypothetical protein
MAKTVQLLIGTRKGAFIAEGDTRRKKWKVKGPSFPGKDVFHVIADPRNEGHLYAAANSGFFGPTLARSTDGGHKWRPVGMPWLEVKANDRPPDFPKLTTGIVNLWNITPGPENEPKSLYLGIDPASLYRSDDSGATWTPLPGLNEHATRPKWNPGAGGMCLHTIVLDPRDPKRMYVGISAAGTFRSDDGGERWQPLNKGVKVSFMPDPYPIVGQCVHKIALDPGNPDIVYRQDHDGIYVSMDRMESWKRIGRPLDFDFGFATATVRHLPGTAFFVPLWGETRTMGPGHFQVFRYTLRDRKWKPLVNVRQFPGEYGMHREGLATDPLDPAGIYVGTTNGAVIYSPNEGRTWDQIPYSFPAIHSVEVAVG